MRSVHVQAKALVAYGFAAAVSVIAAVYLLELWKADLHVPFDYLGDALLYALITKSTLDHGWFWTNSSVGAPEGLTLYDYPVSAHDTFHIFTIKLLSVFDGDWAFLFNIYFLLGFPLITWSAMTVFRRFGVGYGPAIVGAVLYSFLPSRLLKGEGHLFLDVFYQVPLAILVLLWVCGDSPPLVRDRVPAGRPTVGLNRKRSWASLAVCALTASTSLYYAFFISCLLAAGGIWASIQRRSIRNAIAGLALAAVIVGGLGVNGLPSILYHVRHGPNHQVIGRGPWEAERYGMKIAQLLLPVDGHRLPALRRLKEHYSSGAPLVGENATTSLGLVGDVGFLMLLGMVVSRRQSRRPSGELLWSLGVLNLMALLLGTIGGFGSLFALLVNPQIRTYSRINVLIAFFALFAVVLLLDQLHKTHPRVGICSLAVVLVLGLFDQATGAAVRPYAATKSQFASDADIVHRIEATVPSGTAIFELPYTGFPDTGGVGHMAGYDPIRPYLHSRGLRWSYPAMAGRPGDAWAHDISLRPPSRMLAMIAKAGFGGILIDRNGYDDDGCGIERASQEALGAEPIVSKNGRLVFFRVPNVVAMPGDVCGSTDEPCCFGNTCASGLVCNRGKCECGGLGSKQTLGSGQVIVSCDHRLALKMQSDGDLVLSGCGCTGPGGSCWSSHSAGHAGAHVTMQGDGNLVMSAADCQGGEGSCWTSNSVGHPGASLAIQSDGNLCISGSGCPSGDRSCWCSRPSHLDVP